MDYTGIGLRATTGRAVTFATVIVVAAACSSSSASPTVSAAGSASIEPGASVPASSQEGAFTDGELAAGTYTVDLFDGFTLTLTLDQPYSATAFAGLPGIGLSLAGSRGGLYVFRYDGKVFSDPCEADGGTLDVEAFPESVVAWLTSHAELIASEPQTATLPGATGLVVELTAQRAEPCSEDTVGTRIYLFALPEVGDFHLDDGEFAHLYALTVADDLILVVTGAIENSAEFVDATQPVIDSMVFTVE